jgi:dihydrofolate reductase
MRIKARMGISADGYVAATGGIPALIKAADFVPGRSHGYPEFVNGCDAVVMGRQTFLAALDAPAWAWRDLQVFVLISGPLPASTPDDVIACTDGTAGLVGRLRARGSDGDVHLVGGPRTIRAVHAQRALDSLEIVVLPLLLGQGIPLWPYDSPVAALSLSREPRVFPDGSVELAYTTT